MLSIPEMVLSLSSMTSVTSLSMTVALAPLMVVLTATMGKSTSGVRCTPMSLMARKPKRTRAEVRTMTVAERRRAMSVIFMDNRSPWVGAGILIVYPFRKGRGNVHG